MKPQYLKLCAWGSYAGEEIVDFQKFKNGGIFLITGPTGSGKTTIFDAISFALFGDVSGKTREKTSLRSDFASPEKETYVELTFQHRGKLYYVRRTPKYEKAKKNGEGYTTKAETATFQNKSDATEPVLATVKEVNAKVKEVVGITYEQFKQIAMIAQGEFLDLLVTQSKTRVEILRNLFQTKQYELIQTKLNTIMLEVGKDYQNKIVELNENVRMANVLEEVETSKNKTALDYEKILVCIEEKIKERKGEVDEVVVNYKKIKELWGNTRTELEQATVLEEKYQSLHSVEEKLQYFSSKKELYKQKENSLKRAQQAMLAGNEENSYINICRYFEEERKKCEQLKEANGQANETLKQIQRKVEQSEDFKVAIQKSERHKVQLEQYFPIIEQLEQCKSQAIQIEREEKQQSQIVEGIKKKILKIQAEKEERSRKIEKIEGSAISLSQREKEYFQKKTLLEQLKELLQCEVEYQQKQTIRIEQEEKHKSLEMKKAQLEEKIETLKKQKEQSSIQELINTLEEGRPCPVCGSLHHPSKLIGKVEHVDESKLEMLLEELENLVCKHQESLLLTNTLVRDEEHMHGLLLKLRDKTKVAYDKSTKICVAELSNELKKMEEDIKCLQDNVQLELKLKQEEKELEQKEKDEQQLCQQKEEVLATIRTKLERNQATIESLETRKQEKYETTEQVKKKIDELQHFIENATIQIEKFKEEQRKWELEVAKISQSYENSKQQVQVYKTQQQDQKIVYESKIKELGFESVEVYQMSKMTNQEQLKLQEEIKLYDDERKKMEQKKSMLLEDLKGKEKKNIIDLKENLNTYNKKMEELETIHREKQAQWERMEESKRRIEIKLDELKKIEKKYSLLTDLGDTARGKNKENLIFEQYVLSVYFEEIIYAANLRLSVMTSNRFQLMIADKVADARTKDSLHLEVLDHYTGKKRSVKTLSGGESFKAALALALGLSDVVQQNSGGIEIETLFIDEGFGALDSESLEQALKALGNLTTNGRMIGIISHVNELKERIDEQVIITKSQEGSHITMC